MRLSSSKAAGRYPRVADEVWMHVPGDFEDQAISFVSG
jgi:hypothetical protein